MMSINKSDVPGVQVAPVKHLDLLTMLEAIASDTLNDVSNSFYEGDSDLDDDQARVALHRIRGRMQTLRLVVRNIK